MMYCAATISMPPVRRSRWAMKARTNSTVSTNASSDSPQYGTSERVGFPILQRLTTDIRAELDYVRMGGKQELLEDPAQEMAVRKPSIHFSPSIPARNNRSFDWFVIGENETVREARRRTRLCRYAIVRN